VEARCVRVLQREVAETADTEHGDAIVRLRFGDPQTAVDGESRAQDRRCC